MTSGKNNGEVFMLQEPESPVGTASGPKNAHPGSIRRASKLGGALSLLRLMVNCYWSL